MAEAADGETARFSHALQGPLLGESGVEFADDPVDLVDGVTGFRGGIPFRVTADQRQKFQCICENHQPGAGTVLLFLEQNFIEQFGNLKKEPTVEVPDLQSSDPRNGVSGQPQIGADLGGALKLRQQLGKELTGEEDVVDAEPTCFRIVVGFAWQDEEDIPAGDPVLGAAEAVRGAPFANHDQFIEVIVRMSVSHAAHPVMDAVKDLKFKILPVQFGSQEIHRGCTVSISTDPLPK